jgi:hypothetical protein
MGRGGGTDGGIIIKCGKAIGGGGGGSPPPEGDSLDHIGVVDAGLDNAVHQLVVVQLLCGCLSLTGLQGRSCNRAAQSANIMGPSFSLDGRRSQYPSAADLY